MADIGDEEFNLYLELKDSGYIDGELSRELNRSNRRLMQVKATLHGRQYHDQLRKQIFKESWKGRSLSILKFVGGFIVGILAMVAKDEIKKFRDYSAINPPQHQDAQAESKANNETPK